MEYLSVTECRKEVIKTEWFTPSLLPPEYKKYINVEYDVESNRWTLEADTYIGVIPLNADFGIQILPKSGLKNLTYMLYQSGLLSKSLETPFKQTVPYQVPEDDLESFFEGLVHNFLRCLDEIKAKGLVRNTIKENKSGYVVRGKIDYSKWINKFGSTGGIPIPQEIFSSSLENIFNRLLLQCLEYLALSPLRYTEKTEILQRLDYFGVILSEPLTEHEQTQLEWQIENGRFPTNRYYYLPAINLALLILRGAGLGLGGSPKVKFKPFLINTSTMFEKYIRRIVQNVVTLYSAHADDGKQFPLQFYSEYLTPLWLKPDIVIRRGGRTIITVDVKYKFAPTEQDHYQLWAYMEAYDINYGGFISIQPDDTMIHDNPAWYRRNDKSVFDFSFDCKNIKASENNLEAFLSTHIRKVMTS